MPFKSHIKFYLKWTGYGLNLLIFLLCLVDIFREAKGLFLFFPFSFGIIAFMARSIWIGTKKKYFVQIKPDDHKAESSKPSVDLSNTKNMY